MDWMNESNRQCQLVMLVKIKTGIVFQKIKMGVFDSVQLGQN